MGQLIDDLLLCSRMGRQDMMRTTVDLGRLVSDVLESFRLDLQTRHLSWTIDPLPLVAGDPAMLAQVFVNLIDNAVKFTRTQPTAEIPIGVDRQTATEIVVFVCDNGLVSTCNRRQSCSVYFSGCTRPMSSKAQGSA